MFRKKKLSVAKNLKVAKLKHSKYDRRLSPRRVLTPTNASKKVGKADEIPSFFEDTKKTTYFIPTAPYPIPLYLTALPKQHRQFGNPETEEGEDQLKTNPEAKDNTENATGFYLYRSPSHDNKNQPAKADIVSDEPLNDHQPSALDSSDLCKDTVQTSTETLSSLLLQSLRCYSVELPMLDDVGTVVLQHTETMNTVFKGYRRDSEGKKGYAESNKLFRAVGDQIVTIDGVQCIHKPFEQVLHLLQQPFTLEQTHKRILLISFSSKKKKNNNIA